MAGAVTMRIKRLEVQGFKSFKDKTVIHFDHSITGIVGPNGCGKSNIVDAFFWVMGEQSYKHMRGTGADDLIFNGSSKYQPLGLAEATLVMELEEPDLESAPSGASSVDAPPPMKKKEVSVTRRVFRSGEGEYFINGVPARLKDIHELFMDTGVGAKGYSVIEQGQIGKVVNSKPEERRLLIEEAAGIAKYKARKKESLRKMEATQGNLSRLNDVITEIERQVNSLERQAQKARQYRKYKDELVEKETTWGRRKIKVLRQKLDAVQTRRQLLDAELQGMKAELQTAENSLEVDRIAQLTATKALEASQERAQTASQGLTEKKSALELSRRRRADLDRSVESLEIETRELALSLETVKASSQSLEEEVATAQETLATARSAVESKSTETQAARSEAQSVRGQLESVQRELMKDLSRSSQLTAQASTLLSKIEAGAMQKARIESQSEELELQISASTDDVSGADEHLTTLRAQKEEAAQKRSALSDEVRDAEARAKSSREDWRHKQSAKTQVESKLQSLLDLEAAHEGFEEGPKAVLEWARTLGADSRVRAVADAMEVTSGYEAAAEGWLQERLQDLISEDPDLAFKSLEWIQAGKKGRASIHIAPELPRGTTDFGGISALLKANGFEVLGDLSLFVKIKTDAGENVARIAQQLISHVAVVREMAPVAAFVRKGLMAQLHGWSLTAIDGSALSANGILRGGAIEVGERSGLMARKTLIRDLEIQLSEAALAETASFEATTASEAELQMLKTSLDEARSSVQALEIEETAARKETESRTRALQDLSRRNEQLGRELETIESQTAEAREQNTETQSELEAISTRKPELEANIAHLATQSEELQAALSVLEQALNELRVNEASVRARSESLGRELEGNRSVIADRERRLSEVSRQLERARDERAQFSGGEDGLEQEIALLTSELAELSMGVSAAKDQLEGFNAGMNAHLDRIKEIHAAVNSKTTENNELAVENERVGGEISHLVQNLEEKYGVGCLEQPSVAPIQEEMDAPIVTAEMSAEEELLLGEEVERLRERIRRLGEVNVMAVEEYEEMNTRFQHLLGERRDLEQSIENLQEAINHINKTSEERFKKAFDAIANRFERLFPIIFGGGSASLSLVFPEGSNDILEAGVDILAQPPGKKVSNITLLSGGEKALTAVSLIFAIFMVKPSPFCLLDEVDAPLDDANIGKFNALLREMAVKSQFIIITHNKKTMELNDTLYGVTMEEPGVSKMVSIEMH